MVQIGASSCCLMVSDSTKRFRVETMPEDLPRSSQEVQSNGVWSSQAIMESQKKMKAPITYMYANMCTCIYKYIYIYMYIYTHIRCIHVCVCVQTHCFSLQQVLVLSPFCLDIFLPQQRSEPAKLTLASPPRSLAGAGLGLGWKGNHFGEGSMVSLKWKLGTSLKCNLLDMFL